MRGRLSHSTHNTTMPSSLYSQPAARAWPATTFVHAAFILLFAAAVQVTFVALLPDTMKENESSDYRGFYAPLAENLALGRGYLVNGNLSLRYPPGFSTYLAPQFYLAQRSSISVASIITATNVLVSSISCLLLFSIAKFVFTEQIAMITTLLWATYPFQLWLVKQPNSEVPFILVFYLAALLYLRGLENAKPAWFAAAGLFLGIAALIRPIAVLVAVLLAAAFLLRRQINYRRRSLCSGLLVASFLLAILPWEAVAWSHTRRLVPLSSGGMPTFLVGLTFNTKGPKDAAWVPGDAQMLIQRVQQNRASLDNMHNIAGFLMSELRTHPKAALELALLKAARSWYGTDSLLHEGPISAIQLAYLLLIIPGIWVAWRRFPQSRSDILTLILIGFYFWGITVAVLSILRYMVPIMGLLLIFGAVAIESALSLRRLDAFHRRVFRRNIGLLAVSREPSPGNSDL